MVISHDLILIIDSDEASLEVLRTVVASLGCDHIEVTDPASLAATLAVRRPTLVVLGIDRADLDGYAIMQTLIDHGSKPPTLLVGTLQSRVLAGVRRTATARGLPIVGTRHRPLRELDIEQTLAPYVSAPPPTSRAELERALAEHEFTLFYQPKVSLKSTQLRVQGVEALIRWNHPRRGLLQPRQFLPAVETHNLVTDLTDYVITESVRQAEVWRRRGLTLETVVNLSPRLIRDREFPNRLAGLLREYDVPPAAIVLDVTETAGQSDRELLLDVFTRLRILGVGLSLDNFGTGVSSLTELYRMPFSEIKIDHALLADVARECDAELVVRAVISLAHTLGLTVCAEGVETRDMLDFARSAGFDSAQGRLFCAPVPANAIERLVDSWPDEARSGGPAPNATPHGEDTSITRRLKRLHLLSFEAP